MQLVTTINNNVLCSLNLLGKYILFVLTPPNACIINVMFIVTLREIDIF
jgi:hypothetical protein